MKRTFSTIYFISTVLFSWAQSSPIKWGDIPSEHLEMKIYEADSSAHAVILCDFGELEFQAPRGYDEYTFKRHKRIKILNKNAIDQLGHVSIDQWIDDEVYEIKAQVILPDGKKIKVKKSSIFKEQVNEQLVRYKFTFPNIVTGSILEYKYKLNSKYVNQIKRWVFQSNIPTLWSEYRTSIPKSYHYVQISRGRPMDEVVQFEGQDGMLVPHYRRYTTLLGHKKRSKRGVRLATASVKRTQFIQKEVPALKEEPFITRMDDYLSYLELKLDYISYSKRKKQIIPTWEKAAKNLTNADRFGKAYSNSQTIQTIINETDAILSNAESNEEKVEMLYNFVATKLEWNGIESKLLSNDLLSTFKKGYGNSADLNLMLLALLKHYEIESYPLLVSTRDHGQPIQPHAILDQFNHVITLAKFENEFIAIDVDDPNRPLGYPRTNSLNLHGWIADVEDLQWIEIPNPSGKTISSGNIKIDLEGHMIGNLSYKFEGCAAIDIQQQMTEDSAGYFLQNGLKDIYPDIEYQKVDFQQDQSKVIKARAHCHIPFGAQLIDDLIYFSPIIEADFTENPFKLQNRSYPVDMTYPIAKEKIINIDIPVGYVIEELPSPINIGLKNRGASFQYKVVKINHEKIQLVSKLNIQQIRFAPVEYEALKNFFDLVVEKQGEQVVLRKDTNKD
jgi:hypothetical protein